MLGVSALPASADTNTNLTLFYAVPNSDGTTTIAGLLHGAPDTSYDGTSNPSIEIDTQPDCHDEGGAFGVPNVDVVTDDAGNAYFSSTFASGASYLYLTLGSSTFSNCYPVGPDNTAWSKALDIPLLGGAGALPGRVALEGETRWYKFHVTPDSTATVTLSGLTGDDGLAVFGDIGAADAASDVSGGTQPLTKLSAEFASDAFSPSAFIPSAFSPSAFIPSAFIPSAFTPSAFIPSAFIPSAFIPSAFIPSNYSPSAFIPSGFVPSAFIPSAFILSNYSPSADVPTGLVPDGVVPSAFIPSTYSSAVSRSLISYDDEGGAAAKTITVNTWQDTGDFYVAVTARNGDADPDSQFQVAVNAGNGACSSAVAPIGSAPDPVPAAGIKTVILTDSSRVPGTAAERADLADQLQTLAARPEVAGAIVDLASDDRVSALDAQADSNASCPYATNLVANAVKDIVTAYRVHNPVQYVVVAGGDSAVPFFRHPDQTLMGNETGYTPPVADSSASQASLRLGYTLSDNDYGATDALASKDDSFPVPDIAVGRLVETASEISGQVQAYLGGTVGGVLPTPTSSLVTGYDFLTFPAQAVQAELAAGTGHDPDTLIAPRTLAPSDPASWTGADLRQKVLDSGRHDIIFLAGHFSANDALAADYTTDMLTTDMEQSSVDLTNSLVFSAGCHSGYNIVNGDAVPNVTLTLDWPEEFARKRAILIGGTGYQYGDTDFIAYSEQIYTDFSHQLRVGTGPVSLGDALLRAKQDYLTSTPDPGAMNQKAVLEATLYGLPMASIDMPFGRTPAVTDSSVVSSTTAVGTDPGNTLDLHTADLTVTPQLTEHSTDLTNLNDSTPVTASYLSGTNGIVTNPYQPVLPLESENVSVPDTVLRGAMFLGGAYHDTTGVTPLTGAPATDIRGVHTGFSSSAFFPEKPWSINYFGALDGNGSGDTRLMVTPAQHRSDPDSTTDVRRQFDSMNFRLFYSPNTTTYGSGDTASTPALAAAPDIVSVESAPDADPTAVDVCVTIGGAPTAGVQDAVVTWADASHTSGNWQSADLTQGGCDPSQFFETDSTAWGGKIALGDTDPANLRFMVQAVNGLGLVSMDDNLGAYYSLPGDNEAFDNTIITHVQSDPASAPYGSQVTLSAQLNHYIPGGPFDNPQILGPMPDQPITFSVGTQTASGFTDDNGVAHATVTLDVPPAQYHPAATFNSTEWIPSTALSDEPLSVTEQPTVLTLTSTPGPLATGDTSFTARVCATAAEACGDNDPPVSGRTVVFVLNGPGQSPPPRANAATAGASDQGPRITGVTTDASGEARFDAYGLTPGSYSLDAYFDGTIPGVGTLTDSFYLPATASAPFTTTFVDADPPTLTVPTGISVTATSPLGAVVAYTASATDTVDPRPQVSCTPSSVTLFPVGTTTASCTATDTAGNSVTESFPVTVEPTLSPGTTSCNGTYGGTGTDVEVPPGATCHLVAGATVTHDIVVRSGGVLDAEGVHVGRNLTLGGAKPSTVCGSQIDGNLRVANDRRGRTPTVVGDPASGCAGDRIGGSLFVTGSQGLVTVAGTSVHFDLTVSGNSGRVTLDTDTAGHDISITDNHALVTITQTSARYHFLISANSGGVVSHHASARIVSITANTGSVVFTAGTIGVNVFAMANTATVTLSNNAVTHDITVSTNTGPVVVKGNSAGDDITVKQNQPGGATVIGNHSDRNSTCVRNVPQSGNANTAGGTNSCPT